MSELIGSGIAVCVVDDDEYLREQMVMALQRMGFGARGYADARGLYLGLLQAPCDVLVLDLNLKGEDGFAIVEQLHGVLSPGILVLTACDDLDTQVRCLTNGADAYLVKPVDFRQLAATLISLSRRVRNPAEGRSDAGTDWRLAGEGWVLVAPDGQRVDLTASERELLGILFDNANTAVRRDAIIVALGHHPDYYLGHRLDMLVSRLRRKVSEELGVSLPLKAVRGIGFLLSLRLR